MTVYLPLDAAALSAGAEDVANTLLAEADKRGASIRLVRTGTRGMLWLEPLAEITINGERIGYGPLTAAGIPALFDAGFLTGGDHPKRLGPVEHIPWFARQERLTFARCGVIDPLSLADYEAHGGLAGLRKAAKMAPEAIIETVTQSGLRGRGGAGFPAGIKWKTALEAKAAPKYVCANADEGDSGAFADRMVMEGDPFSLLEGMIIAGLATRAEYGLIYLRSEYPHAERILRRAIAAWEQAGLLGDNAAGSGRAFHIELRRGAGAYICGEETSMLDSLEGRRGLVRFKPPLPAIEGLHGKPTVINNILTLAAVPWILVHGGAAYAAYGMGRSRGTQPFQLAGNIARGGLVEKAFGVTLKELVEDFGGGTMSGRPVKAAQLGGPLGAHVPAAGFDVAMDYEALAAAGAMLGHGGIVVFDDSADMARLAQFAMEFCAIESCGKCTPCRIGSVRGAEIIERIRKGENRADNVKLLQDLCEVMTDGSLCAMGGLTPMPVRSALQHFPEDFGLAPKSGKVSP
ncbi:MAG: formate dehydrogenase [Maricaulaceae bacterium]|nr:formate dehydrogenase [Maricaulaceae bacterium]